MTGRTGSVDLVLASRSRIRAQILENAGIAVRVYPSAVDEDALKRRFHEAPGAVLCLELAAAKAQDVSARHPDLAVIGADQVLACDGELLDKPRSFAEAEARLRHLRNRTHTLHAGLAVARNGNIVWRHEEPATLTMRDWSDSFLRTYLEKMGPSLLEGVGAYRLEDHGAQLFSEVRGDYFAILGLPLLPLLAFLRKEGILPA